MTIRILNTLKNGEVSRMEIEGGDALPRFIKTNQAACAFLIADLGIDAARLVTFRNVGSAHDSFVPTTVGAWAAKSAVCGKPKPAAAQVKTAFASQPLPGKPRKGTLCAAVWDMMDELGADATNAQAIEVGAARGLNAGNVRVEASRWRKYHALKAARQEL